MNKPLSIYDLLNDNNEYIIPLYQRNFSWTEKEISQLIIDILDSKKYNKDSYYIGTLVVCKRENEETQYDVIDGQQRFTALLLLFFALQNLDEYSVKRKIEKVNLRFEARKLSDNIDPAIIV